MRSLFAKIFIYFLLTIVLSTLIGIILTYSRDREFPPMGHRHFAKQALAEYGRDAVKTYEDGGAAALSDYVANLRDSADVKVFLFGADGVALAAAQVEKRDEHMIRRLAKAAGRSGRLRFSNHPDVPWMASALTGPSGKSYVIVVGLPPRPALRHIFKAIPPTFFGVRSAIIIAVSALLCYVLARTLTAPIRALRQATQRFAAGDFSVRVADSLSSQGEFSELGRDFDQMAQRIASLLNGQKQLLSDISHELRSPLARLGVALELARKHADSDAENALNRIEKESLRLNEMIGQLLDLASLDEEDGTQSFSRFDLTRLIADVVRDAVFEAHGSDKTVRFEAAEPVFVRGDVELLRRAIDNVVRNALTYTAEGTAVEVLMTGDEFSGSVGVTVCDHGPGIPDDVLDKIFEPFYRVQQSRDRRTGGAGLGLAIAQRAVKRCGGSISATNRRPSGLEIQVRLPVEAGPASTKDA